MCTYSSAFWFILHNTHTLHVRTCIVSFYCNNTCIILCHWSLLLSVCSKLLRWEQCPLNSTWSKWWYMSVERVSDTSLKWLELGWKRTARLFHAGTWEPFNTHATASWEAPTSLLPNDTCNGLHATSLWQLLPVPFSLHMLFCARLQNTMSCRHAHLQ